MRLGGIVVAGGKSSRMGYPKALLPFGPELLLQRVVRVLGQCTVPVVVVAAQDQLLPTLSQDVLIVRDEHFEYGPLAGLFAGLQAIESRADAAFVTACDAPFLSPAVVQLLCNQLATNDIVVPTDSNHAHALAAIYRTTALSAIRAMLAEDTLRLSLLLDRVQTRRVSVDELHVVDRELLSLRNLNNSADYLAALHYAGFQPLPEIMQQLQR